VDLAAQRREMLLIITRLSLPASKTGSSTPTRTQKRDLVRALVRRAEIGPDGVNLVFRVDPAISSQILQA